MSILANILRETADIIENNTRTTFRQCQSLFTSAIPSTATEFHPIPSIANSCNLLERVMMYAFNRAGNGVELERARVACDNESYEIVSWPHEFDGITKIVMFLIKESEIVIYVDNDEKTNIKIVFSSDLRNGSVTTHIFLVDKEYRSVEWRQIGASVYNFIDHMRKVIEDKNVIETPDRIDLIRQIIADSPMRNLRNSYRRTMEALNAAEQQPVQPVSLPPVRGDIPAGMMSKQDTTETIKAVENNTSTETKKTTTKKKTTTAAKSTSANKKTEKKDEAAK